MTSFAAPLLADRKFECFSAQLRQQTAAGDFALLLHDNLDFLAVGCFAAWHAGLTPMRISKQYLSSLEAGTITAAACTAGAAFLLHQDAPSALLALFGDIVCVNTSDVGEEDAEMAQRNAAPSKLQVGTWGFVDGEAALETDECLLADLANHYPLLSCCAGRSVDWR